MAGGAGRNAALDVQDTTQVNVAGNLPFQLRELHAHHRSYRGVANHHAGVCGRQQVFLGIGELVGAAQFAWLVDLNLKLAIHLLGTDVDSIDKVIRPGSP